MTKLSALLISFSLHELVESVEIAFLLKFGNWGSWNWELCVQCTKSSDSSF